MDKHAKVDEERVDTLTVRRCDSETLKGVSEKYHDAQEKDENHRHYASGVWGSIGKFLANAEYGQRC